MVFYALIALGLFAYAIVDVGASPSSAVRTLPKPLWFLMVVPPVLGPLAWLLFGRPRRGRGGLSSAPPSRPIAPDDDEEFLRELRRRSRDPRDDAA